MATERALLLQPRWRILTSNWEEGVRANPYYYIPAPATFLPEDVSAHFLARMQRCRSGIQGAEQVVQALRSGDDNMDVVAALCGEQVRGPLGGIEHACMIVFYHAWIAIRMCSMTRIEMRRALEEGTLAPQFPSSGEAWQNVPCSSVVAALGRFRGGNDDDDDAENRARTTQLTAIVHALDVNTNLHAPNAHPWCHSIVWRHVLQDAIAELNYQHVRTLFVDWGCCLPRVVPGETTANVDIFPRALSELAHRILHAAADVDLCALPATALLDDARSPIVALVRRMRIVEFAQLLYIRVGVSVDRVNHAALSADALYDEAIKQALFRRYKHAEQYNTRRAFVAVLLAWIVLLRVREHIDAQLAADAIAVPGQGPGHIITFADWNRNTVLTQFAPGAPRPAPGMQEAEWRAHIETLHQARAISFVASIALQVTFVCN